MISEKRKQHLARLAILRKGKHHSIESKLKISESRKKYTGDKHPRWKGGKMNSGGYIYIFSPDHPFKNKLGYVLEHRLVVEESLNRFLTKKEVVHHINQNKSDNRLTNLILFSSSAEHTMKEHTKRDIETGRFV